MCLSDLHIKPLEYMAYSIWCELCFAYLKFIIWGGFCMEHIVILYKYYSLSLKHIFLGEGIRFLPHFGKAILPRVMQINTSLRIYMYVIPETSVYTKTTAHRVLLNSYYIVYYKLCPYPYIAYKHIRKKSFDSSILLE